MPAKLSLHIPDQAVLVRVLADGSDVLFGREPGVEVTLNHASVSRRHARLTGQGAQWQLTDLDSKNGTRIAGSRISNTVLVDQQWFALGDVFCQFELIDAHTQQLLQERQAQRRDASAAFTARLPKDGELSILLAELLRAIVQVAECQRGFLLTLDQDVLQVAACFGLGPEELRSAAFSGSRSAVDRVVRERRAVYLSSASDRAWLQQRASVMQQGICALACLPLLHEGELLGVAYADTSVPTHVFTDLDAEVLGALVERASSVLAAARIAKQLAKLSAWVAVDGQGASHVSDAPLMWPPPAQ